MENKKFLMTGAALVSLSALAAQNPALAATGTGVMNAVVKTALVVSSTAALDFGSLTVGAVGGTLQIQTDNTPNVTGDVSTAGGTPGAGSIKVTGAAAANVQISAASPTYTVNDGGGHSMDVTAFRFGVGSAAAPTIAIGGGGTVAIPVGATLNVGAAQTAGSYTGNYTVNVVYN